MPSKPIVRTLQTHFLTAVCLDLTDQPFDTPSLMTEVVEWFNAERQAVQLHPLLLIGIWVVVFLEIHPFQDSNARLSRVLTILLLLQQVGMAGYGFSLIATIFERPLHRSIRPENLGTAQKKVAQFFWP